MIKIYTTKFCGDCIRTKAFLNENNINFKEIDIETNQKAFKFVISTNHGNASVPTIIFEDGSILTEPSNRLLASKLELKKPKIKD